MRHAANYLAEAAKATGAFDKPKMPETDFARVVAAYLEPTTIVCGSKVMHFDGNRWQSYDTQFGAAYLIKEACSKAFTPTHVGQKHGKWEHNLKAWLTPAFVKTHGFLTAMRLEALADLSVPQKPDFDENRHLLAGRNGMTLDTLTGTLHKTHPTTMNTKCLNWALEEWDHPAAHEYRGVVRDIIAHWNSHPTLPPDLQVGRGCR